MGLTIAAGMRVLCRDAEWLVQRVEASNVSGTQNAVHVVGVDDLVRGHQAIFLTQLDHIEPVDPRQTKLIADTSKGFRKAKLFLEAQLRQMPATGEVPDLNGLGAFSPMPFQITAMRRALEQLRPRLLLADAVGLGKTIQVGMIMTELMRRGRGDRILVLAKKSMLTQFQAELWNRFNIPLVRLDSQGIAKLRLRIPTNKNPFEVYHRIIISIDTLKDAGRYRHFLEETRWDLVVIDEAHNVAGASVPENHLAHRLARLLSRRTDSMLLTTATPHNGKRATFGRLISLLDPSAIPDPRYEDYDADDIRGFYLMRFKEDVRGQIGKQLMERVVVPLSETTIEATPAEENFYGLLGEMRRAAIADTQKDPNAGWRNQKLLQYGYYSQFLSSPESCAGRIANRINTLQSNHPSSPELPYLRDLLQELEGLSIKTSSRFQLLCQQLKDIGWTGKASSPRVLIFTEYVATQRALAQAIAKTFKLKHSEKFEDQKKQAIASISATCPDIHLMAAVEAFSTNAAPVRMMVATDVASEGINLHHQCHHIIHYDLPWSIITLIQRNGRIDRIGQTQQPIIRYLMVKTQNGLLAGDTTIFERLIQKVEEINRSTRSGESQLQLYNPEKEAEYLAEKGLLTGNAAVLDREGNATGETADLELTITTGNLKDDDDLLAFLLGDDTDDTDIDRDAEGEASTNSVHPPKAIAPSAQQSKPLASSAPSRIRFYSDMDFLQNAYDLLREKKRNDYPELEDEGPMVILTAPEDLKRRLGGATHKSGVIFGATAIPAEAWPEYDRFQLTDSVDRVSLAIEAARNTSGYWSKEMLCSETHPIMQWLVERLMMEVERGEALVITSKHLQGKELAFCFVGQVPSKAGTPLVVDAHAVRFRPGGESSIVALHDVLQEVGFESLANVNQPAQTMAGELLVSAAVEESLKHLKALEKQRQEAMMPLLRSEERRLKAWKRKRRDRIKQRLKTLEPTSATAQRLNREQDEINKYINSRQREWRDVHLLPGESPITQLVLVIEGVS